MDNKKILLPLVAAALLLSAVGCGKYEKPAQSSTSGIARVACDESFANILNEEISVFEYIYPDVSIKPEYMSEKAAIDSLLSRSIKTVVISRPLTKEERDYLSSRDIPFREQQIAVDAIALIVNPQNPINELTTRDLKGILTGEFTSWGDIEPVKLGEIKVVFDDQSSSTVRFMRDSVLGGAKFGPNVYAQGSSQAVFDAVASNPNAVGILGVSWMSYDLANANLDEKQQVARLDSTDVTTVDFNNKIKVLKLQGPDGYYKPYQAYLLDGKYPYTRPIYMVVSGAGGTPGHGLFTFITSFRGQKLILSTGVMPAVYSPVQATEVTLH